MNRRLWLATCFTILTFATTPTAVLADVVFGNLGASGTNALSNTNSDITSTYKVAVPFTTGSSSEVDPGFRAP